MVSNARKRRFVGRWRRPEATYGAVVASTIPLAPVLRFVDRTGQVCGTFSLRRIGDERMHLSRFGIDPALRRRGLGKFMLGTASDLARTDGATLFTLVVYEHNAPARRLYESCGFVPSHEQHKLDPDQVLMELRL